MTSKLHDGSLANFFGVAIKKENDSLKAEKDQLKEERDSLRAVVSQLQTNQRQTPASNPFGTIGSNLGLSAFRRTPAMNESDSSMNNGSMQSPTESDTQKAQLGAMLRNLGRSF